VISKQAQEFWALLKTYPKQIAMPLAQAREADTRSEDFTSEPVGVNFMPASEVDGLWAEIPEATLDQRIDTPSARAIEDKEKEAPAIQ
jgi:hypothetical protein